MSTQTSKVLFTNETLTVLIIMMSTDRAVAVHDMSV